MLLKEGPAKCSQPYESWERVSLFSRGQLVPAAQLVPLVHGDVVARFVVTRPGGTKSSPLITADFEQFPA